MMKRRHSSYIARRRQHSSYIARRASCTFLPLVLLVICTRLLAAQEDLLVPEGQYIRLDVAEECFGDKKVAELAVSAARGDLREFDKLLLAGANPNAQGKSGLTPVIWAMKARNKAGYARLLDRGASADCIIKDRDYAFAVGRTLIGIAARNSDDSQWLRILLKHSANPNLVGPKWGDRCTVDYSAGMTPLFDAIDSDRAENLDLLIEAGANVNHQDNFGNTPMMDAARHGKFKFVQRLLQSGADCRIRNNDGEDAAYFTAGYEDTQANAAPEAKKVMALFEQKVADVRAARSKVAKERRVQQERKADH